MRITTLKELKDVLNKNNVCDNGRVYVGTDEGEIGRVGYIEVDFDMGGEPVVYIMGVSEDFDEPRRDNYTEVDRSYWDKDSYCFDNEGRWSPNGKYNADECTRDDEDDDYPFEDVDIDECGYNPFSGGYDYDC